jgi:hypothetical protein
VYSKRIGLKRRLISRPISEVIKLNTKYLYIKTKKKKIFEKQKYNKTHTLFEIHSHLSPV